MSYDFADRLIEMRRSRGLSQEELAKDLGLSRQAISKWERAESAPDIGNLVALADIYDVTLDELVRGAAQSPDGIEVAGVEVGAAGNVSVANESAEAIEVVEAAKGSSANEVVETAESAPEANEPPSPPQGDSSSDATMPPPPEGAVPVQVPIAPPVQPIKRRNPLYTFPYALLVVLIYLVLGFVFGLWHPGWVIFFTIPFYYWIASVITHDPEFEARHKQYYGPSDTGSHGHRGPYPE